MQYNSGYKVLKPTNLKAMPGCSFIHAQKPALARSPGNPSKTRSLLPISSTILLYAIAITFRIDHGYVLLTLSDLFSVSYNPLSIQNGE